MNTLLIIRPQQNFPQAFESIQTSAVRFLLRKIRTEDKKGASKGFPKVYCIHIEAVVFGWLCFQRGGKPECGLGGLITNSEGEPPVCRKYTYTRIQEITETS